MQLPYRESYDMAAAVAEDVSGGGRGVLIGAITHYDGSLVQDDDKLHGYLDDSTSANGSLVCSAGYLFEAPMAREFRNVWKHFLESNYPADKPYFHATDDIRRPDAEKMFSALAQLTRRTAMRGLVNFVEPKRMSIDKSIRGYIGSAFSETTLGCMKMMADVAKEQNKSVVYFVEDGNRFAGELRHFLNQIKDNPQQVDNYAMAGADTYSKKDVIQLQGADLLAWSFIRSHYRGSWVKPVRDLVQDGILRHTMGYVDPQMQAMVNSFHRMQSNRTNFD